MVTILAADPGAGKSLVALDLARRIIHGEPFPDGAPVACPGSPVLLVDAEGALSLLRRRVEAWQIDPDRLLLMVSTGAVHLIDLSDSQESARLFQMCRDYRPALVVVDALASAAPRAEGSLKAARDLFGALSFIAGRLGLAMLVIHHHRKRDPFPSGSPRRPIAADLRGSGHILAAARSVLALSLHGSAAEPKGPRRLEVVKSNLCLLPPPLSLTLEPGPGAPTLHYAPLVDLPPPPTRQDLCAQWLLGFLAAAPGPVRPAVVVAAARAAGFSKNTLYRARRDLGSAVLDIAQSSHDPNKRWTLPHGTPRESGKVGKWESN